jgi:hypothetical protein
VAVEQLVQPMQELCHQHRGAVLGGRLRPGGNERIQNEAPARCLLVDGEERVGVRDLHR